MTRKASKILTPGEKRSLVADARATVRSAKSELVQLRKGVTAAKKCLRSAESAFNKQQRAVVKAEKMVSKLAA